MRQLGLFDDLFGPPPASETPKPQQESKAVAVDQSPTITQVGTLPSDTVADAFIIEQHSILPKAEQANAPLVNDTEELPEEATEEKAPILPEAAELTAAETSTLAESAAFSEAEEAQQLIVFANEKIGVKIKQPKPREASPVVLITLPRKRKAKEKVPKVPQKRGRKSFKEIEAMADLVEIPEDDVLFSRQYYAISEVAGWFRVNTSLLRFWENQFDILKPRKNRKGDRLFRPEDVKNLLLIHQLLRQKKYTVEGAKEYLKNHKKKADLQLHLTQTLTKFRTFLLDLKANL